MERPFENRTDWSSFQIPFNIWTIRLQDTNRPFKYWTRRSLYFCCAIKFVYLITNVNYVHEEFDNAGLRSYFYAIVLYFGNFVVYYYFNRFIIYTLTMLLKIIILLFLKQLTSEKPDQSGIQIMRKCPIVKQYQQFENQTFCPDFKGSKIFH